MIDTCKATVFPPGTYRGEQCPGKALHNGYCKHHQREKCIQECEKDLEYCNRLIADLRIAEKKKDKRIAELEETRERVMSSELHVPPQVADAMRALRPELRKKLSLRDIDDMTRPFRKRIAELEDERQQWLEWNERKGPGLEAYREQGQRIAELEDERDIFKRTLDKRDKRIAELEPDATAYRKLCDIRKRHPGIPCACEFSDDNSDTVLSWCEFHKQYRDFMREYDRAAKQHAMPSYLDDARKAEGE